MKRILISTVGAILILLPFQTALGAASADATAQNRKTVLDFYNLTFNNHKPAEAVEKYIGARYVQHNPAVADGKKPFVDFFLKYQKDHSESRAEVRHIVSEGNLVVLHVHAQSSPADRGRAVVDIFRLEGGKIVEHWDVTQPVPEKSANQNTMF